MEAAASDEGRTATGHEGLHFYVLPWHKRESLKLSDFDLKLRSAWQKTLNTGIFLHGVESEPHRIPGKHGFVGVLCRNRASQKRKSQSFTQIIQKPDPSLFNFTKVKEDEVLFKVEMKSDEVLTDDPAKCEKKLCHFVINNSPYEFAHTLMVPELHKLQIQSITLEAIRFGIETLLRSSHPGFRVMYNSLCGGASVNHLHLHCYYTEYWLNSEAFRMQPLEGRLDLENSSPLSDCFELDFRDCHVRGFGFVITRENYGSTLPDKVHKIVQYFTDNNIAHNIVIIRGVIPDDRNAVDEGDLCHIDNGTNIIANGPNLLHIEGDSNPYEFVESGFKTYPLCGRLYIFPRLPILGEKCYRKFLVNVTELFGHLYFGDADLFNSMTEEDIVDVFHATSYAEVEFASMKTDIIKLLR